MKCIKCGSTQSVNKETGVCLYCALKGTSDGSKPVHREFVETVIGKLEGRGERSKKN